MLERLFFLLLKIALWNWISS